MSGSVTVEAAAARFVGDIEQTPPMVSAVKVAGQRLHKLARMGKEVERKPRALTVYELRVEDLDSIMHGAPMGPRNLQETGLGLQTLLNLMIKAMYSGACDTPAGIAKFLNRKVKMRSPFRSSRWKSIPGNSRARFFFLRKSSPMPSARNIKKGFSGFICPSAAKRNFFQNFS